MPPATPLPMNSTSITFAGHTGLVWPAIFHLQTATGAQPAPGKQAGFSRAGVGFV